MSKVSTKFPPAGIALLRAGWSHVQIVAFLRNCTEAEKDALGAAQDGAERQKVLDAIEDRLSLEYAKEQLKDVLAHANEAELTALNSAKYAANVVFVALGIANRLEAEAEAIAAPAPSGEVDAADEPTEVDE